MSHVSVRLLLASLALALAAGVAQGRSSDPDSQHEGNEEARSPRILKDESQLTSGFITIKGARLNYQAEAGLQVVYVKDPKDDDPPPRHDDKGEPAPIPQH